MKTEILKTTVLKADDGKILTDGSVYGKTIYLAANRTADEFYEIAEEKYEEFRADEKPMEG